MPSGNVRPCTVCCTCPAPRCEHSHDTEPQPDSGQKHTDTERTTQSRRGSEESPAEVFLVKMISVVTMETVAERRYLLGGGLCASSTPTLTHCVYMLRVGLHLAHSSQISSESCPNRHCPKQRSKFYMFGACREKWAAQIGLSDSLKPKLTQNVPCLRSLILTRAPPCLSHLFKLWFQVGFLPFVLYLVNKQAQSKVRPSAGYKSAYVTEIGQISIAHSELMTLNCRRDVYIQYWICWSFQNSTLSKGSVYSSILESHCPVLNLTPNIKLPWHRAASLAIPNAMLIPFITITLKNRGFLVKLDVLPTWYKLLKTVNFFH